MINRDSIQARIAADARRLRAIGITEEDERDYYTRLSLDVDDPAHDSEVFDELAVRRNLAEPDRAFVKRVLDDGDGR